MKKHKFSNWLAMRSRLHTADKIARYDLMISPDCLLCGSTVETQEHLLFHCCYSKKILEQIKIWIEIHTAGNDLSRLISWIASSEDPYFKRLFAMQQLLGLCMVAVMLGITVDGTLVIRSSFFFLVSLCPCISFSNALSPGIH